MTKGALLILVNNKNDVLLQHKDAGAPTYPNKWCLFGGGIEAGENAKQTIHREFIEELEWELGNITYFGSYSDNDVFYTKTDKHADTLRKKLHEGNDLGYFSETQILNMDVAGPHLQAIKDYFAHDKPIVVHFICRGNALRSIIAEAYLNSLEIKGITVLSSGTFAKENKLQNEARQQETRAILKQHHLLQFAKSDFAEQLTPERLKQGDLTICVNRRVLDNSTLADSLPDNTIFWDITDIGEIGRTPQTDKELNQYEEDIFNEIIDAVDNLVATYLVR